MENAGNKVNRYAKKWDGIGKDRGTNKIIKMYQGMERLLVGINWNKSTLFAIKKGFDKGK